MERSSNLRVLGVFSADPFGHDHGDKLRASMVLASLEHLCASVNAELHIAVPSDSELWPPNSRMKVTRWTRPPFSRTATTLTLVHAASLIRRQPAFVVTRADTEVFRGTSPVDLLVAVGEVAGAASAAVQATTVVWDKSNVLGASTAQTYGTKRVRGRLATFTARSFERRTFRTCSSIVFSSQEESQRAQDLYGLSQGVCVVFPSAVTLPIPAPRAVARRVVGWLGHQSYKPNYDGLRRFLEQMRQYAATFELEIVGSGALPADVRKLAHTLPNVRNLGYVQDLDKWMGSISAAVVPVWSGAGVKLKTLTLMAHGVPVVGTSCAFEGLPSNAGNIGVIKNDEHGLVLALEAILDSPRKGRDIGRTARQVIESQFNSKHLAAKYGNYLANLAFGKPS